MEIIVCVKPAPDPKHWDQILLDPVTKALKREGIPSILGPLDKRAIEEGLRIKETHGGKVAVMAMAPPAAKENLVEALAMGGDEAYLFSDRAFAGSDTWATAMVLSKGIQKIGTFDLILCGNYSLDGSTGHVGAQLAEFLDIPHVGQTVRIESIQGGRIRTKSLMESGYRILETRLPALLTVSRDINTPRFTTLLGVMEAEGKPFVSWSGTDIEINSEEVGFAGSYTQTGDVFMPQMKRKVEMLQGDPEGMIPEVIRKIRQALG